MKKAEELLRVDSKNIKNFVKNLRNIFHKLSEKHQKLFKKKKILLVTDFKMS